MLHSANIILWVITVQSIPRILLRRLSKSIIKLFNPKFTQTLSLFEDKLTRELQRVLYAICVKQFALTVKFCLFCSVKFRNQNCL